MIRSIKSMFLGIVFILTISFILPGCYTQLSRPRVDTEDEYYDKTEDEEVDEYYQDEGVPPADDSRDVYIYNYYPYYWNDYYDYWYYSPYRWGYSGPYPHYWWDPYAHWWTPGWYAGFYYYDYWWGGDPRYYGSYHRYGNYTKYSQRIIGKRPFTRRSIRRAERERPIDAQPSLTKPVSPNRVKRSGTTLSTPSVRDKSLATEQQRRTVKEMVNRRLRSKTKSPTVIDNRRSRALTKKSSAVRKPKTIKSLPRSSKSNSKPDLIKRAPSRQKPTTSKKSYSPPQRSKRNYSSGSKSSGTRISRPATRSYTPRSSSSSTRSTTRSSPSRSSSSGSKSSGSSRTGKK